MTIPEVFRMFADEIEKRGAVNGWKLNIHTDPDDVMASGELRAIRVVAAWEFKE